MNGFWETDFQSFRGPFFEETEAIWVPRLSSLVRVWSCLSNLLSLVIISTHQKAEKGPEKVTVAIFPLLRGLCLLTTGEGQGMDSFTSSSSHQLSAGSSTLLCSDVCKRWLLFPNEHPG